MFGLRVRIPPLVLLAAGLNAPAGLALRIPPTGPEIVRFRASLSIVLGEGGTDGLSFPRRCDPALMYKRDNDLCERSSLFPVDCASPLLQKDISRRPQYKPNKTHVEYLGAGFLPLPSAFPKILSLSFAPPFVLPSKLFFPLECPLVLVSSLSFLGVPAIVPTTNRSLSPATFSLSAQRSRFNDGLGGKLEIGVEPDSDGSVLLVVGV